MPKVPEPGQVVTVRGSTWAVTEVRPQGLPRSPADEGAAHLSHVVEMQSLEEDRLGEELAVVWELEVGHSVAPPQNLPETITQAGFDDPNTLAAFVDAVRWGAVTSADANSYQAPFRSGANIEAYQLEPLSRALQSSRTNLLLADDVGLGKTIEAGLVIQELLLRHRARSVMVVCPPSLSVKWRDEMRDKFGLDFVIVNSELIADVRRSHGLNANPFRLFPRVIVSMAWLPSLRAQRLLRELYADVRDSGTARRYAFDALVVDEAHHVAPASPPPVGGRRGYAIDSKRTLATRALAQRCEHRLFLSATPHNGYSESFTALLEMIDGRRFTRGATLDERALRDIIVRRLKTDITSLDFKTRVLRIIQFTPSDPEQEKFALLERILKDSARKNGRKGQSGDIVAMLLKKRFLSSPWSFAKTLELYDKSAATGRLPEIPEDDDEYFQEVMSFGQSDEEEGEQDQPEFVTLRKSKGSDPLIAATPAEIANLVAWGSGYEHRPDSKLAALIAFLDAVCRPDGKNWTNERVVVFTEYAATLGWIAGVLDQKGYRGRVAVIQGSTPAEDRETVRQQFTDEPNKFPVRVLLATDSAGEGIDLQDHCHRLVNYDVPFNPSRLEQRIGRIDRYGQHEQPEIFHFAPDAASATYAADLDFMRRIAEKVGNARKDLGKMNQVMAAEVQDRFSPSAKRRSKVVPDSGEEAISRALAGERRLGARLTELAQRYPEIKAKMHLTPANARRVVDTALNHTKQPLLIEVGDDRTDAPAFAVPALGPAWQPALRGLTTALEPDLVRPITFDDEAARDRKDLVHIHLGHAILQRSARILRGALFGVDSPVNRVTAVVVDDLPQSCVAAVSRLVLVGRGGLRLHEEVFLTGVRLRGRAMAETKVEDVLDEALDAENLTLASEDVRTMLAELWNTEGSRMRGQLLEAIGTRAQARQKRVAEALRTREDDDITRARQIFANFRTTLTESVGRLTSEIQAEEDLMALDMPEIARDQQRQRRQDLRIMQDRRAGLADEEHREVEAIRDRYRDIEPHVSAAAVVFALTPADAQPGALR
ncbi:DISARM system SNF2-like helicase DrmD [Nocardia sp. XZ_19_231]|uniref:DISARM system SNF2-like helicase DrmD n=1 Tax=Nocardia sp. XZ_19_231 TaxID=2769252 RepID=UPI00188F45EF|nr:DISARM system SNF2-like helicase DrmD [Nocardia sp. XZ_19_231]